MVNGHGTAHGGFPFTLADSTSRLVCRPRGQPDGIRAERADRPDLTRESDVAVIAEFRGRSRTLRLP